MAITPEDIISWGGNGQGQAGQGERAEAAWVKPRSIKPLQGLAIASVVCGRYHTLCVTATSQVRGPLAHWDAQHRWRRMRPWTGMPAEPSMHALHHSAMRACTSKALPVASPLVLPWYPTPTAKSI